MKVSVVIPAYNEENYLAACLGSLQAQDYRVEPSPLSPTLWSEDAMGHGQY